jgi:DNA mismatch repair protein MutL
MGIVRLSDHVINLIAAGEVVERPVAVVRELVDNSLDAGASSIRIDVIDGGLELIRVTDDGSGMSAEDAVLAFERHATSKLSAASDLEGIATLGFRGEALASIAAVARVKLATRRAADELGVEVTISGGSAQQLASCVMKPGTALEVRGLFFNQPARKKFMKLPRTELSRIRAHLSSIALVNPAVRFVLSADGKELDNFPPANSVLSRAASNFGEGLVPVEFAGEVLRIQGGVTHPGTPQKTVATTIVNGRVVTDRMILRAIREGYDSMLKSYELPGGFISVSIRPDLVDVNVHPQKSEVRFRDSSAVFVAVKNAVKTALSRSGLSAITQPLPSIAALPTEGGAALRAHERPPVFTHQTPLSAEPLPLLARPEGLSRRAELSGFIGRVAGVESVNTQLQQPVAAGFSSGANSRIRLTGQVLGCYLVGESDDRVVVVDMHAAHERVNFNRIRERMRGRAGNGLAVQELLFPLEFKISHGERAVLEERAEDFQRFGFSWQLGGPDAIRVTAAPAIFAPERLERVIRDALETFDKFDHARPFDELVDGVAARLACHASVRSGDLLSEREAYALLEEIESSEFGGACPHGRPVVKFFSRGEVERWFGRDR